MVVTRDDIMIRSQSLSKAVTRIKVTDTQHTLIGSLDAVISSQEGGDTEALDMALDRTTVKVSLPGVRRQNLSKIYR